jgi:hypothetical protein
MIPNMFAQLPADVVDEVGKKLPALIAGGVISAASFLLGRWWGRYKAGREWKKQEFFHRIIVSINIFADGYLKIRTVLEDSLEKIFLNQVAIDKVEAAAKLCTVDQPILPLAKEDRWYILNYVLNEVAEKFAEGQVKQDAGLSVTKVRYAIFLTCEVVGPERIRKVRAMLLQEQHLKEFPYREAMPNLENPWHADRIKTLRKAVELYAKEPDHFLILEVCV